MLLGISSFSFGWAVGVGEERPFRPLDAGSLVGRAVEAEVRLVQFGDNLPLTDLTDRQLQDLWEYAASNGIQLEVGTRGYTADNILEHLRIARILRAHLIRIVIDLNDYQPELQRVVEITRQVLPRLEESGVQLAVENHDRFPARELAGLVRQIQSPQFGICLDMVNSMGAGEGIETVLDQLLPYTLNLHVKDFTIRRHWHQMGFVVEGCPAGQGKLDIPTVLQRVKAANPMANAVLEQWAPPEENLEETIKKEAQWAGESLAYLKGIMAEIWPENR